MSVMWWNRKRDEELGELRAELKARDQADQARRDAQRHAEETGWGADGRWSRPTRASRDRLSRGES